MSQPTITPAPTALPPGAQRTPAGYRVGGRSQHPQCSRPRSPIPWWLAAMPAYSGGFLAPVPFLYAALNLRRPKLWFIAAAYLVAWMVSRFLVYFHPENDALSAVGGALTLALAVGGTVHAFVLRESLLRQSRGQVQAVGQQRFDTPVTAPVSDPTQSMCGEIRVALASLTSSVRTHAALLPAECKQLLDEIIVQIEQVVSLAASGGHAHAELRSVHAIATDYLPTSINTYARLPREYALTQHNPGGRTAAEELQLELRLLRNKAKEAADSLHHADALRLQAQTAFLHAKFGKSELDIP